MIKIRGLAQVVGFATLGLLAVYGLLTLVGGTSPFGLAVRADAETLNAPGEAAVVLGGTIPQTMNYQGFLRNPDGSLTTGSYTITARIYYGATTGSPLYETTVPNVAVRDGLFNIVLGDAPALPSGAFADAPCYIGIDLNDGAGELIPRQRLHAVPWALTAETLVNDATVNGLSSTRDVSVTGDLAVTGTVDADALTISGTKPIIFKDVKGPWTPSPLMDPSPPPWIFVYVADTEVSHAEYICGVVGYQATNGDIDEGPGADIVLWASSFPGKETWVVNFAFPADESFTVRASVLCVDRGMAEQQ